MESNSELDSEDQVLLIGSYLVPTPCTNAAFLWIFPYSFSLSFQLVPFLISIFPSSPPSSPPSLLYFSLSFFPSSLLLKIQRYSPFWYVQSTVSGTFLLVGRASATMERKTNWVTFCFSYQPNCLQTVHKNYKHHKSLSNLSLNQLDSDICLLFNYLLTEEMEKLTNSLTQQESGSLFFPLCKRVYRTPICQHFLVSLGYWQKNIDKYLYSMNSRWFPC